MKSCILIPFKGYLKEIMAESVLTCLHWPCAGLRKGQRQAIAVRPQAMLEAKDLQKCDLSNYLTERLDSLLERDRMLRAERDGCPLEAVSFLLPATSRLPVMLNTYSPHQHISPLHPVTAIM